jgi:uncharacterized protein (UPF0264 family)
VSVRSAVEARAALEGGAALIDVKEPRRGSLGQADAKTVDAVVRFVAGRCPVSAALGELVEEPRPPAGAGLAFAKWGLAGCGRLADWRERLAAAGLGLRRDHPGCRPVAVAYADWRRAGAPPPQEVCAYAAGQRWGAFLLDTWAKDGTTLLDWITPAEVFALCRRCRQAGIPVALAGSLRQEQMERLLPAWPDWFAVRGAVCRGGDRQGGISNGAVRRLVRWLARATKATPAG